MIRLIKNGIVVMGLLCLNFNLCIAQCPSTTYPLCSGESYTLTAQNGLTNIQWQIDMGSGYINISGATNSTYIATAIGKYKYTAKDINNCTVEFCCPFSIIAGTCPCPAASYMMCDGESYTITAQSGLLNIQWQVNTGSGYNNIIGAINANYIATTAGMYKYSATDGNGCVIELCCPISITVLQAPDFTITKPAACPGNSEDIVIGNLVNATSTTATISVDGGIYSAYPSAGTISGLTVGMHTIDLKNSSGCITSKSISINDIIPSNCIPVLITKN